MSYPKPLSEKTLARMYREANIDDKKKDFLHKLFLAAVNLYGAIALRDLWEILKKYAQRYDMKEIKRMDLINFSSIVRRENVPYYVYEVDELYAEEKRSELNRELVHKSLVGTGSRKFAWYYGMVESQLNNSFYLPDDLLAFAVLKATPIEKELLEFLKKLRVTAKYSTSRYGVRFLCDNVGKTLGSFSFRNRSETFQYEWYSGKNPEHPSKDKKALQRLLECTEGSEAEKILRVYKRNCNIGSLSVSDSMQTVFDELIEVGVQLTDRQFDELTYLLTQFNNSSHLWCIRGWTPIEIVKSSPREKPKFVTLGPGIKQSIAEGKISLEEIEEELRKRGLTLVD